MRALVPLVLLALTAAVTGCGGDGKKKLYPVTGKVTYQNKPATGAMVVFHPKGDNSPQAVRPFGTVQPDGTYSLQSGAIDKGAPAGEYDVAISWDAPPKAGAGMGNDEAKLAADQFGGRYKDPTRSGLKATVNAGPTEVPAFDLK